MRMGYVYNLFNGEQPTSVAWSTYASDVTRSCNYGRRIPLIVGQELHQLFTDAEINVVGRPHFSLFAQRPSRIILQLMVQFVQHMGHNLWKVRLRFALRRSMPRDAAEYLTYIFPIAVDRRHFSYADAEERVARTIEEYFPRAENVQQMVNNNMDRFVEVYREIFMASPPAAGDGLWAFRRYRGMIVHMDIQRRNMAVDDIINVAKRQRLI